MSSYVRAYSRPLLILLLTILLVFSFAGPLFAAEFRGDDTVTIGQDEVIDDDLLVGGNIVVVNGVINGDLIVMGQQVTINGHVKGSLVFAGQVLTLNGQVDGTVYGGASTLTLGPAASVGRNLMYGGFSYRSEAGSVIGRDNIVGGYQATINGKVNRNLLASLGALELNGFIGGNVDAVVEQPGTTMNMQYFPPFNTPGMPPTIQPGLRVGPEAKIVGKFSYSSPVEQTSTIAATPGGGVTFTPTTPTVATNVVPTRTSIILDWLLARLREFATLFVLGALALWLIPTRFGQMGDRTMAQTLVAAAWGVLVTILGYGGAIFVVVLLIALVAALAALTLAGLATTVFALGFSTLGLAFTIFSMLMAYGSKLVVIYPLTHALLERMLPSWNHYRIVPMSLGILAFVLLTSIPYLGALLSIAATLIGMGAIWMVFRDGFTKPHVSTPKMVLTPA
jgi:hypothetical protein